MKKFNSSGDIHFATFRTFKKFPYFKDEKCCLILLEEFFFRRDRVYPVSTISRILQSIKGSSARRIIDLYTHLGSQEHLLLARNDSAEPMLCATPHNHRVNLKYRIWQPGFYDFNIYTDKKFWEKLDYIHNNPIKHGLTDNIAKYKYCSLRNYELGDHSIFKIDYPEG
ncbi:MAG TPA: hypothetical protein ENN28_00830 [Candidatus Uhrbacteria bacterium]|nr:hypothetical protein [Candidatus Uhrbacteria bacterium]